MNETGEPRTWHLSVVMTATRDGVEVFDTLDDMPPVLRARCVKALDSKESQTVVIADEAGREYLRRLVAQRDAEDPPKAASPRRPGRTRAQQIRLAAEIAVCGAIGLTLWLLATMR